MTMDRRRFLTALGCSVAASPFVTPMAFASAPWDNRLVVIILRGAMDGLDVIRPVGDPDYAGLRPTLAAADGLPLSDFWHLHPALAPLVPLYESGEMGAFHAVSTPYRDKRSHFDGQDILEAGYGETSAMGARDGWLNRLLQATPGIETETAFAIGRDELKILAGDGPVSRWSPDANLRLSSQAQRLLEMVHHDDPLFRDASAQAIAIAHELRMNPVTGIDDDMMAEAMMGMNNRGGDHVKVAEFAAGRLRGDTRIASFSINGWDTHLNQRQGLTRVLSQLSDTILTLRAGLGPVWGKTAVLCMTEFGRTARENGTRGTDHGTGGAMIYAGGALRGGQVAGDWPGLGTADLYQERDLMPMRDVRGLAGWVMRNQFGLDRAVIEDAVFPGLDLSSEPGFLL
jgi:uncharacterized protein (DUF1501 family)